MKVYFAMPTTYFDDPGLQQDIEKMDLAEHQIYVPNSPEDEAGYKAMGMDYFRSLIAEKGFSLLVFRSFANGRIGKDVADEIGTALNLGIPVCEVVDQGRPQLLAHHQLGVRELTVAETRAILITIRHSGSLDGLGRFKDVS